MVILKIPGVLNVTSESGEIFRKSRPFRWWYRMDGKDPNLRIEYYGNKVGDDFRNLEYEIN